MNGLMRSISLLSCFLLCNPVFASPIIIKDDCSQTIYSLSQKTPSNQALLIVFQDSDDYNNPHKPNKDSLFNQILPNADRLFVERYAIDENLSANLTNQRPNCLRDEDPHTELINIDRLIHNLHEKKKYNNIIVIGGYQGASIAYQLAAENSLLPLNAVITFNSARRKFVDEIEQATNIIGQLQRSAEPFHLTSEMDPVKRDDWLKSMPYFEDEQLLTKIDIPVLIIQTTRNINIDSRSIEQMIHRLSAKGKKNISYTTYADLDYYFIDSQGDYQERQVINDVNQWMSETLANRD